MKVKELRDKLAEFPDELEVFTKKTDIGGNCGLVGCVREDEYSRLGFISPCVLITDEFGYEESDMETENLGDTDCMDEDAKYASIPYTYNAPQHDWKCGYPDIIRGKRYYKR